MVLVARCILLSSLLVTALCLSCENGNDCVGNITCSSGQKPACSREQCFCKTGARCRDDRDCSQMCTSAQTYHCRQFRCYCSSL